MTISKSFLLNLYIFFRKNGFNVKLHDYLLLYQTVHSNIFKDIYKKKNINTLKRLCKSLWVKYYEDEIIFEMLFDSFNNQKTNEFINNENNINTNLKNNLKNNLESNITNENIETIHIKKNKKFPETIQYSNDNFSNEVLPEKIHYSDDNFFNNEKQKPKAQLLFSKPKYHYSLHCRPPDLEEDMYFPATRDEMRQYTQNIKLEVSIYNTKRLDINNTIKNIHDNGGKLIKFVFKNDFELSSNLIFIDKSRSMSPFDMQSEWLLTSLIMNGCIIKSNIYIFDNDMINKLYRYNNQSNNLKINELISCYKYKNNKAIIFSDAGASRGSLNAKRIRNTQFFIKQLKSAGFSIVWLNPLPEDHWYIASADLIKNYVPMFDLSVNGLKKAIMILS